MIRPPGLGGAAFSTAADGDLRGDLRRRRRFANSLGISGDWATVSQVHGAHVVEAHRDGDLGSADGIFTKQPGVPIAVFAADCVPVVLESEVGVGVAHAGWRGLVGGVVEAVRVAMSQAGAPARRAAIGPSIGPCCYEVGPEVIEKLSAFGNTTTWGAPSVDLRAAAISQLGDLAVEDVSVCTHHGDGFSHRRDKTTARHATVAWVQ